MWRPILRLAYPLLCAVSFVLCLATTALWVRSTQTLDRLRTGTASRRITLHVKEGEIYIDVATASRPVWAPGFQRIHASPTQFRPPTAQWSFVGFAGGADSTSVPFQDVVVYRRFVAIPLWILVVMTLVLPVLWYDAYTRRAAAARDTAKAAVADPPRTSTEQPTITAGALAEKIDSNSFTPARR